jgi:hypothetical protein
MAGGRQKVAEMVLDPLLEGVAPIYRRRGGLNNIKVQIFLKTVFPEIRPFRPLLVNILFKNSNLFSSECVIEYVILPFIQ